MVEGLRKRMKGSMALGFEVVPWALK